jgi:hypothetical protein
MNQTFFRLLILKNAVSLGAQPRKNIVLFNKWFFDMNLFRFQVGLNCLPALTGYRWRRFVATAVASFTLTTCIEEVVLPLALLLARHGDFSIIASEVGLIIDKAFCEF